MIFTNFREIDGAGRIVISKDIRNHLNIKAGDVLHIEADNDCITIKKAEENIQKAVLKHIERCATMSDIQSTYDMSDKNETN